MIGTLFEPLQAACPSVQFFEHLDLLFMTILALPFSALDPLFLGRTMYMLWSRAGQDALREPSKP